MNEEEFEFLQGEISALSAVLSQVITAMDPLAAAKAALGLAIEIQTTEQEETPETTLQIQMKMMNSYLELLQSVSSRD